MSEHKKAIDAVVGVSKALEGWDGSPEDAASKLAEACRIVKEYTASAPAQAREDEALALVRAYIEGCPRKSVIDKRNRHDALNALAALRSRQRPQAEDSALPQANAEQLKHADELIDILRSDIDEEGPSYFDPFEAVDLVDAWDYYKARAAASQPSPQGEDAYDAVSSEVARLVIENDELRARLASAQSSAQGDEAREMGLDGQLGTMLSGLPLTVSDYLPDDQLFISHKTFDTMKARAALECKETT